MKRKLLDLAIAMALTGASALAAAGQFDCLIEPRQSLDIRPSTEGLIQRINVQRGDVVRVGQILVELDAGLERASADAARYRAEMTGAVKSKESRVDYLGLKSTRREKLAKDNFISVQDRDETAAEHRLAESDLVDAREARSLAGLEYRRASEQVRLRTIRSPIDGIVTERLMNPGELADNRDVPKPILKLAQINVLHVEVLMPIAAYDAVKLGQSVDVVPDQPIGGRHPAKVTVIDKVFDAASGTFGARLELANANGRIPAGIKCKAIFEGVAEVARVRPGAAR
jgi:RND family efflux transporter MFP subunit